MTKARSNNSGFISSAWLGLAERVKTDRGTIRLRLRWSRILIVLLAMTITGWLGKSVAFYYFFKNIRQFDEVSFLDMLAFPVNQASVRLAQGNYQIEQGKAAFDRGDYLRARNLLQQGVARAPDNLEGRMLLIQLFSGWRPELALQLLRNGYEYGRGNEDFVRSYFSLLMREREDTEVIELANRLLDEAESSQTIRRMAGISLMQSAIQTGNYPLAAETYRSLSLYETPDGILLACDVMTRIGQTDRAIMLLEALIRQFPNESLDAIQQRLITTHRNAGNYNRARQQALSYAIQNPENWQARVLLLESIEGTDSTDQFDREALAILGAFRNNEEAMRRMGSSLTRRGDLRTARMLYDAAVENFFDMGTFSLMLVETSIRSGDYSRAIRWITEWEESEARWFVERQHLFNAMRALAHFRTGNPDRAQVYLNNFRNSRRATAEQLLYISGALTDFELKDLALSLLETASTNFPTHEQVLTATITLKIELGDGYGLADQVAALLNLRRPDYSQLQTILEALNSDRFVFTPNRRELISRLNTILQEPQIAELDLMPPSREAG